MISAESLLVHPQRIVDPFNRISRAIQPTLLAVEFCQIEGPRPLSVHTSGSGAESLDLDGLCVWLMSSETATGTILSLYNQQMAIYALSYYTTFYDIRARAFQRPVCFSYLSSQKPNGAQLMKFSDSIRKLVSPALLCNRRLFFKTLADLKSFMESVENTSDKQSEQIQHVLSSPVSKHKYQSLAEQVEKIYPRVHQLFNGLNTTGESDCRGHPSTSRTEHIEVLNLIRTPGVVKPLAEVAPCTFSQIAPALEVLLAQLSRPSDRKGALYSCQVPVLRLGRIETPIKRKGNEKESQKQQEHSLKTLTPHLDDLLYTVLAGDDLVVCGGYPRKQTVVDIVVKLNALLPRCHANNIVTAWSDDAITLPHGIVGLAASKTTSVSLPAVSRSVLDVNSNNLRTIPYTGILLAELRQRRRFPTDETLVAYLTALISRICGYVYLARHVPLATLKMEGLSVDDERIIAHLLTELDVVKYQSQRCELQNKRVNSVVKCINL